MEKFFSKTSNDVLKNFNVTKEGLTDKQVAQSIEQNGYNELTEKKKKTAGLCKRLLARRKMKRQIQSYEAEGEEKVN